MRAPVEGSWMGKCSSTTASSFVLRKGRGIEAGRKAVIISKAYCLQTKVTRAKRRRTSLQTPSRGGDR